MRRSRGRRRVGLRGGCPFKEAGGTREGRMRPSLVQEAKRTSSACLRGIQPEGPGSCRQEPEHVAPVTGYGAKAPAGFPLWMSMVNSGAAIPGRNDRYGARCDAQRLSQDRQQDYPRRFTPRPAPSMGRRAAASRRVAPVRMRECARRVHLDAPCHDLGASRCTLHRRRGPQTFRSNRNTPVLRARVWPSMTIRHSVCATSSS